MLAEIAVPDVEMGVKGHKWAPSSLSECYQSNIRPVRGQTVQPLELAGDWEGFCHAGKATNPESLAMLDEIRRKVGHWRGTWQLLGVTKRVAKSWAERGHMSRGARRLIWLTWLMVCRPEVFPMTFFDLACYGRTTVRADPATAGGYVKPFPRVARPRASKQSKPRKSRSRRFGPDPLAAVLSSLLDGLAGCDAAPRRVPRKKSSA